MIVKTQRLGQLDQIHRELVSLHRELVSLHRQAAQLRLEEVVEALATAVDVVKEILEEEEIRAGAVRIS